MPNARAAVHVRQWEITLFSSLAASTTALEAF
jgi:hypothetical protein